MAHIRRLVALAVLAACAGREAPDPAIAQWRVTDTALVSIPDAAADGSWSFGAYFVARWTANGEILVGEPHGLYLFDSAGRYLRQLARGGEGPGELSELVGMADCGPDIAMLDRRDRRAAMLTTEGQLIQSGNIGLPRAFTLWLPGCYGDTPVIAYSTRDTARRGTVRDPLFLIALGPDLEAGDTLLAGLASERAGGLLVPFGAFGSVWVGESAILLADNAAGTVIRYRSSGADTIAALLPRHAIAAGARDSAHDAQFAEVPPSMKSLRASLEAAWAQVKFPDSTPRFGEVMGDGTGRIWLEDYAPTGTQSRGWTVLDSAGNPLGHLTLPAGLRLQQASGDRILGIHENEDGSLAVEVRQIEKS